MKGLIGKKLGMTQVYDKAGNLHPVTVIEVGPCTVLALRTIEKHGYAAIQLGFGARKVRNTPKAIAGHVKAAGLAEQPPAVIREIRLTEDPACAIGQAGRCAFCPRRVRGHHGHYQRAGVPGCREAL